jgi:PAS domain S-box-containing protein
MLGSSQPMFVAWGPERIMLYNDGYAPLLGKRHPRALGTSFNEVWHDILDQVGPFMDQAYAGVSTHKDDLTLQMYRNGYPEEAHFSFSYTPVRSDTGEVVGMFCACAESTEAAKARASLEVEKERLRELFQQAPGFMVVLRGPQHVFELVNDAYLQLVGHRRDIVGKPVREALPEVEGQGFFELLDEVYTTGKAFVGRSMPVMLQRHPGGTMEQRYVDLVYQPITDSSGAVNGIFAEGSDVTDRVQGEFALRESEARRRQVLNSVTDYAIISTDLDGRVTSWNEGARRVLGWTEEEMLGQSLHRFFTPEDVAAGQVEKEMRDALGQGVGIDERWHQRKNGERFWAVGELTPLKDDAGTIIGFVKVLRDRTEQRRAEEHQGFLINELNHRVKNTLSTVQAIASQTFRGDRSVDAGPTFEGRLFALSKAHDVLTRENWEGAELREIVDEAVAPYRRDGKDRFEIKGPKLRLQPRAALAIAMALHELATNAAKYGSLSISSGHVAIQWSITSSKLRLLNLRWEEKNGPPVSPPSRKGFGTRLIQRSLALDLGGSVDLAYEPTGVVCVVTAPLEAPSKRTS